MSEPTTPYGTRLSIEQVSREIGKSVGDAIRGALASKGVDPDAWGFTLFIFSYGEGGHLTYVSSAKREDCREMIREWLASQDAGDPGTILPPNAGGQN